jgi:hypothetical protein
MAVASFIDYFLRDVTIYGVVDIVAYMLKAKKKTAVAREQHGNNKWPGQLHFPTTATGMHATTEELLQVG